jgi:hypothetical protein
MEDERVLREGLRAHALSAEAMARIRAAVQVEWRANVVTRRPRRWLPYAAAICLVAVASLEAAFLASSGHVDPGELAARLVRFESPGVLEVHALLRSTLLTEGAVLNSGNTYRVNGLALLALEGGGNLRLAANSEFEIVSRDEVRLESGEMYVDIPPGIPANAAFTVRTSAGEFHHVGTQFALAVNQHETRLRVREGNVHWLVAGGEATVHAGTEVVFANDATAVERPIDPSSKDWDWTATITPDFEIDNRPLEEFLEWVARESGRKLILVDDQVRRKVATIRMHGSVHGLTPMQALSAVMAATELRYDLPDGQLRVSSASETAPRN